MRWQIGIAMMLVACGSGEKPASTPKPQSARSASLDAVHEALVAIHRQTVGDCFGGFGKGAPYTVKMTLGKGRILKAEASPLGEKYGRFPGACVEKHFTGVDLVDTSNQALSARFAVRNPTCELPACPKDDQPCTFKRDIACSVVIDP